MKIPMEKLNERYIKKLESKISDLEMKLAEQQNINNLQAEQIAQLCGYESASEMPVDRHVTPQEELTAVLAKERERCAVTAESASLDSNKHNIAKSIRSLK